MNQEVLFMFAVFILYFLIPLIPATIIYKLFPDTKVAASGMFNGMNVKTTGAFAAYLVALIAGIFIVNKTIALIEKCHEDKIANVDFLWQVKSNFKVVEDSTMLDRESSLDILDNVQPKLEPSHKFWSSSDDGYIVYISNSLLKANVTIAYAGQQCETKTIRPGSAKYKRDYEKKEIDIGDIIIRKTSMSTGTYHPQAVLSPSTAPPQVKVK